MTGPSVSLLFACYIKTVFGFDMRFHVGGVGGLCNFDQVQWQFRTFYFLRRWFS